MLLKLCGAALLTLAGAAGGGWYAKRLRLRRDFLCDFIAFLDSLATLLRYRNEDIFTSVNSAGELIRFPLEARQQPFAQAWEAQTAALPMRYALSRQDTALLHAFGTKLGATDIQGQLSHIALYRTLFEKQLAAADEDIKSKAKLYRTLGIFTGASAALMMI